MVSLDTVKIKTNLDDIESLNLCNFDTEIKESGQSGQVVKNKLQLQNSAKPKGLGLLCIDNLNQEIIIEVSAKILREEYFQGININSLDLLLKNINRNKGIKLKESFLDNALILRCDCTDNLQLKNLPASYIDDLNLYRINHKYRVDDYINKASIVFTRLVKSYKERMTLYDKEYDLLHNDKRMAQILANANRLKDFKNVLRVESNITSFKNIRELFNVVTYIDSDSKKNKTSLKYLSMVDVLSSIEKPNLKIFKKITEKNVPRLFLEYEKSEDKFYKIEKNIGRKRIIKDLDYDIKLIRIFISRHVKGDVSRYIREYKEIMAEMQTEDDIHIKSRIESRIDEIRNLLAS